MRLLASSQRLLLPQFLEMWSGLRQFKHKLLERTVANILSCDNNLKRGQLYSGCLSVLQSVQLATCSETLAENEAIDLLGYFLMKGFRGSKTHVSEA